MANTTSDNTLTLAKPLTDTGTRNVVVGKLEDGRLVIVVDLTKDYGLSKSSQQTNGKVNNHIVSSTGGFIKLGTEFSFSLNVIRKPGGVENF